MTSTIKVTDLPNAGVLSGTEIVPIVQGGTTKRATTLAIASLLSPGGSSLLAVNNLSDVDNPAAAAENLGVGATDSPQFVAVELGHATDTTITRTSAGQIAVEGINVVMNGGALGTPSSGTLTNATGLPLTGITASTSTALGVGSLELGHATDTTIARASAGVMSVEGNHVPSPASQAQGDVLYRGATTWERLAAGTSGHFLKTQGAGANPVWANIPGGGDLLAANNLSDVASAATAAANLGLGTASSPQFAGIELGHATDTTITRTGAGAIAVEGVGVALNSTSLAHTAGTIELGHATDTTLARVSAGVMSVEGETVHTNSISRTVTAAGIELGHATDTTIARSGAGDITIEGNAVYRAGGTDVAIADGGTGQGTAAGGFRALAEGVGSTQGDVLYRNATQWVALGAGTSGHFLQTQGAGANPQWAAASGSGAVATDAIWDAKGDLAVGTGADTAAKLTVGTNGYVLKANSATATGLEWVALGGGGDLLSSNNLSDVASAAAAAENIGVGVTDSPQFAGIELGHATDTTITRTGAGAIAVEGVAVLLSGGALGTPSSGTLTNATGLPVAGIAASTSTALGVGSVELGHATDTTLARVSAGVVSIEGETVHTNSTSRTVTAAGIELGHATDTTISRVSAGVIAVEGVNVLLNGGALGTPSSATLTNATGLPVAGITASTSTALGVGSVELGHATDTTIARASAGQITVEGVAVLLSGGALGTPSSGTLTNATGLPVAGITASTSTALGVGSLELGHATDTTLSRSAAGELAVEGVVVKKVGKETIWIPATAMVARTTNGAAAGSSEMTTNKNMFKTLDFDTTTQEFAQFMIRMPKSWNESTVTFAPVWSHASTTTNFGVVWELAGVAISNDDAGDVAFGTAQASADTGGTTNDIYEGPESSAITIAGTPAAGDYVMFQIARAPSNGSDTMAIDARLHGIVLFFTTDASTDA